MQGKILTSRYRIVQPLAKGGFGETYLAEDTMMPGNPQCVVKKLEPSIGDRNFLDIARRLFQKEAEILQRLGVHDRIPQLLAYFEEEEEFYLVQQYIEGHCLSVEMPSGKRWSQKDTIELLIDCLNIVNFIHTHNVIHRDIKPDNIIRRRQDNQLVLVDFGTVKEVISASDRTTNATVAVGTRGYIPTEQARGKPRLTSDIYSVGMVAIQALTGTHPVEFQEDSNGEIIWQSQANVSPQLAEILEKMVSYHFKDRYQSADEVLKALESLENKSSNFPPIEFQGYVPTEIINVPQEKNNSVPGNYSGTELISKTKVQPVDRSSVSHSSVPRSSSSYNPRKTTGIKSNIDSSCENLPQPKDFISKLLGSIKSPGATTLGIAGLIGVVATVGLLFSNQNTAEKIEKELQSMYKQQLYQDCYEKAESQETKQTDLPEAKRLELVYKCRLGAAQKQAELYNYQQAIEIAKEIKKHKPGDLEVQKLINEWSQGILKNATDAYTKEGKLKDALEMLEQIPLDSPIKQQASTLTKQWKLENETNNSIIAKAEIGLERRRWHYAIEEASKVSSASSMYWTRQAKDIIEEAEKALGSQDSTTPKPESAKFPLTPQPEKSVEKTQISKPQEDPQPQKSVEKPQTSNQIPKSIEQSSANSQPSQPEKTQSQNSPEVIDICKDASPLCN